MLCPRCFNARMDPDFPGPCRVCGGIEPSCCDGPVGDMDEPPTDPNEGEDDHGNGP